LSRQLYKFCIFWYSDHFVLYYVRFLDAKYVSAFFLRHLHTVSGCDFGMLQVDLHTSYMALLFMFPCVSRCVEFAYRRHFNSLCFACTFLILIADWDNSCRRLSDYRKFSRSYYASCMSRSLCICMQMNLMCIPSSCGAPHRGGRFPLAGSLGVGG
jgi:hypothetical protein